MKKLILFTVLALASLRGVVYAQSDDLKRFLNRSNTEKTYDPVNNFNIRFRDFVELKDAKMILDLVGVNDYDRFRNMDSILRDFKETIAFYKDSLAKHETANFRIDYVWDGEASKKIRFRIYPQDGQCFANISGRVSKLKMEQDTVRIIIEKKVPVYKDYYEWHSIQATFILNNYSNIDDIIAEQPMIKHIMDTLQQVKLARFGADGSMFSHNRQFASTVYKPYRSFNHYKTTSGIVSSEYDWYYGKKRQDYLTADFNIGVGIIRNQLSPCFDAGIHILKSFKKFNLDGYNYFGIYVSPYFLFTQNSNGEYVTNTNIFLNAHFGGDGDYNPLGLKATKWDFGLGYLISSKGNYFKNTTMKAFINVKLFQSITLSPELIMTDNFKQVFPGLTLKVF